MCRHVNNHKEKKEVKIGNHFPTAAILANGLSQIAGTGAMYKPVLSLVLLISSCATTDDLPSRQQLFAGLSSKGHAEVAGCISRTWRHSFGFLTRTAESDAGSAVILSTGNQHGVDMIAYISNNGRAEIQERRTAWGRLDDDLRSAAIECL